MFGISDFCLQCIIVGVLITVFVILIAINRKKIPFLNKLPGIREGMEGAMGQINAPAEVVPVDTAARNPEIGADIPFRVILESQNDTYGDGTNADLGMYTTYQVPVWPDMDEKTKIDSAVSDFVKGVDPSVEDKKQGKLEGKFYNQAQVTVPGEFSKEGIENFTEHATDTGMGGGTSGSCTMTMNGNDRFDEDEQCPKSDFLMGYACAPNQNYKGIAGQDVKRVLDPECNYEGFCGKKKSEHWTTELRDSGMSQYPELALEDNNTYGDVVPFNVVSSIGGKIQQDTQNFFDEQYGSTYYTSSGTMVDNTGIVPGGTETVTPKVAPAPAPAPVPVKPATVGSELKTPKMT